MDSQIRASDPRLEAQHLSIHHVKQLCFRRMDNCMAHHKPKFAANAQAVEQMLQLWAKHSGVDARKGMSLDDRLKDHIDLKATFIGLLELIEQKMAQAMSSPDDHADDELAPAMVSTTDEDMDPEEFLIKQKWRNYKGNVWETVGAAVDMLIELTATIRKSSVRNSNLPTHFQRPDDYFAEYAKILARNWFKDARMSLTDQLGDSIFIRRNQMLYKLKHEEKISYPGTHPTPLPAGSAPLSTRETTPGMGHLKETTPRIKSLPPVVPVFANPSPSSTNLSQIARIRLKKYHRKVGALSGITEGSVSIEETGFSYMYPDPPTLGEKQRHGVCPYCSVILPASKLTKEAWRKHLHEDLQPYVCISEKCRDPPQFFSNSTQWLQHMGKLHGKDWPQRVHMVTWYCDREHDRQEFRSESKLREHLIQDHASLSEAHVNALVRRNWGVGCREAHVCPLCESRPTNIIPRMNDKDNASRLFQHISDHLKAIALFSLPSLSTDPANDEQESSSGAQLPTNGDSEADSAGNIQAVAQLDEDLEVSLTFDDDPHSLMIDIDSEAPMNKEGISDVLPDLDAAWEWKFAGLEHETRGLDPVLQSLRIQQERNQPSTHFREPLSKVSLSDQIYVIQVRSVFNEKPFFPNQSLDKLITKESITRELWVKSSSKTRHKADVDSLVEFILVCAKKLFAIVIFSNPSLQLLQKAMRLFREKHITDSSLPLRKSWWKENFEGLWPMAAVESFSVLQYSFLAPVFSSAGLRYDFEPNTILPFTERDPDAGHSTSNIRYRIHEEHIDQQNMGAGRPYYVDLKEAYEHVSYMDPSWESQVQTLSEVNALNHEHLVRFLAAFQRGQKDGYFMFEWASGGNLRNLWRTFHRPKLTSGLVKAAFRQMVGLTSAVRIIHYASVLPQFHDNLNPESILVFKNDNNNELGTLKIGFGELWLATKSTAGEDTFGAERRGYYEAPELSSSGMYFKQPLPRSCDIWSMGCIMLEFLIWLMYGVDGLKWFSQAKRSSDSQGNFFDHAKREGQDHMPVATVAPAVLEWMDHMAADPACEVGTTALGNLLELIRTRLLVVKQPHKTTPAPSTASLQVSVGPDSSVAGQSDQAWERCTSSELEERMRKISDESETEKYWLAAEPELPPLPYTMKCICNSNYDDGNTIYCATCDTWQHIGCFYPDNREDAIREDFDHSCAECKPRPLDHQKAIERALCFKNDHGL